MGCRRRGRRARRPLRWSGPGLRHRLSSAGRPFRTDRCPKSRRTFGRQLRWSAFEAVGNRTLPEPAGHSPQLRLATYALYATLGLQRAGVRGIVLRADGLFDENSATRQLTFGTNDAKTRRIEAAADRARARFGPNAVRPASTAGLA